MNPWFVSVASAKGKLKLIAPWMWELRLSVDELPPHAPVDLLQHMDAVGDSFVARPRLYRRYDLWSWPSGVGEMPNAQGELLGECDELHPERHVGDGRARLWSYAMLVDERYDAVGDEDSGATMEDSESLYTLRNLSDARLTWRFTQRFALRCGPQFGSSYVRRLLADLLSLRVPRHLTICPGPVFGSKDPETQHSLSMAQADMDALVRGLVEGTTDHVFDDDAALADVVAGFDTMRRNYHVSLEVAGQRLDAQRAAGGPQ